MTELLTNPEVQNGYENELVAGFAELADLAAEVLERSIAEETAAYQTKGTSEGMFTGVSLADIEGFMAKRYPDESTEILSVKAAQLYNRIAMEIYELPEPEDLSALESSSRTSKLKPDDVLSYAIAHANDHMEHRATDRTSSGLEDDKIAKFTARLDGDDAFKKYHRDRIKGRIQRFGFGRNALQYPNLPDYI